MKKMTLELSGKEFNALTTALAAIGGRAFGATSARDGIDPVKIMTDMSVDAFRRIGPEGVADLIQRMGDAAERAFGADALTTNGRESSMRNAIPFRNSDLQ